MKTALFYLILALLWLAPGPSNAQDQDKIYMWTDSQGIRHYSSRPPGDKAADVTVIDATDDPSSGSDQQNTRRESFDRMVDRANSQARRLEEQRRREEAAEAEKRKQEEIQRRQAELEAKRKALQEKIKVLENRALSPTFSQGMRDNLIKDLQEQIDELENQAPSDQQ